jgi:glycosyltransferase involved in cell wall biosynthesis
MRVLLWHGWLLEGSGSNVYTAKSAEALRVAGHDVLVLCQDRHPERFPFVDASGTVGPDAVRVLEGEADRAPRPGRVRGEGRVVLLRPEIGALLPVFVTDDYEGFDRVERFLDLTDDALARYLRSNEDALAAAARWHNPDLVVAGHVIPGAVIARRALGGERPGQVRVPYVAKVHGSDVEYAIRQQRRFRELAHEGLAGAVAVVGGTEDVVRRALELVPVPHAKVVVVPPGVDVERFRPAPRVEALGAAADALDAAGAPSGAGRLPTTDLDVREAMESRDAGALDRIARSYDQDAPDTDAAGTVRELAESPEPLVGYLGKFIPQKGVHDLITALPLVTRRVAAVLIGFGGFREWLSALVLAMRHRDVEALRWLSEGWPGGLELDPETVVGDVSAPAGAAAGVRFTGRLDHRFAPHVLAGLDIVVVPSILDEAFGMVAAEGASAGALPLVARHSGLAEVAAALEGAVDGPGLFSFEPGPGASRRIAAGIDRLLDLSESDRRRLREEISAFVAGHWTWDRTARRLLGAAG